MTDRVVVKLSGRVFAPEGAGLAKWAGMLAAVEGVQLVLVAGGGKMARHYITAARSLGADEATLDQMGIQISRLNAQLLISALGDGAHPHVPTTLSEVKRAVAEGLTVVAGGLYPGHSTNGTAALMAEKVGARAFLNATDVDGVYDSDPRTNENAKMFDSIHLKDLRNILAQEEAVAGSYDLMDLLALKVIERSAIDTRILLATPENLKAALKGDLVGTRILT